VKKLVLAILATAVFGLGLQAHLSCAQDPKKVIIRIKGEGSMANLVDGWARAYVAAHPECSIVVSGCTPQEGFNALMDKTAEMFMVCHPMTAQDSSNAARHGIALAERLVAWDGICLLVHPKNPVRELTLEQVRKIFNADYFDWNEVGGEILPIVAFVYEPDKSSMAAYFNQVILKSQPESANTRRYFPSIIKDVSKSVDAIGYAPLALALEAKARGKVKLLAVKKSNDSPAVAPSKESVAQGAYPLNCPLYLYYNRNQGEKHIQRFVDFCATQGSGSR
jgi:phosphate transport system substrate-binding protein